MLAQSHAISAESADQLTHRAGDSAPLRAREEGSCATYAQLSASAPPRLQCGRVSEEDDDRAIRSVEQPSATETSELQTSLDAPVPRSTTRVADRECPARLQAREDEVDTSVACAGTSNRSNPVRLQTHRDLQLQHQALPSGREWPLKKVNQQGVALERKEQVHEARPKLADQRDERAGEEHHVQRSALSLPPAVHNRTHVLLMERDPLHIGDIGDPEERSQLRDADGQHLGRTLVEELARASWRFSTSNRDSR